MKKRIITVFIILVSGIAGCVLHIIYLNTYTKYVPVTNYGYNLSEAPEINTEEHKINLGWVLNDYGVEWKSINGEIYIRRKWILNKKMVNNFTNLANELEFVKYVPVVLNHPDEGFEDAPDLKVNIENLKIILDRYNEKWKIVNGEVYITKRLALDKELVYNYTKKAIDDEFVQQTKDLNQQLEASE